MGFNEQTKKYDELPITAKDLQLARSQNAEEIASLLELTLPETDAQEIAATVYQPLVLRIQWLEEKVAALSDKGTTSDA